jgi:hypothetical protein
VETDREGIAGDVALAELLPSLTFTVIVVKSLVPTTDQEIGILMLRGDRRPFHTPNGSRQFDFILDRARTTF